MQPLEREGCGFFPNKLLQFPLNIFAFCCLPFVSAAFATCSLVVVWYKARRSDEYLCFIAVEYISTKPSLRWWGDCSKCSAWSWLQILDPLIVWRLVFHPTGFSQTRFCCIQCWVYVTACKCFLGELQSHTFSPKWAVRAESIPYRSFLLCVSSSSSNSLKNGGGFLLHLRC